VAIPAYSKKVDFEANILPIFKRNCLSCHNQTDAEGDLVLETPATILKGGEDGPVLTPRKGSESVLLRSAARVAKPHMPPKNNKVGAEALTLNELAILKAWIDQGATGTVSVKVKPVQWHPLPPGLHPILALAVTGDGQFAACGRANQIFVYQVATGRVVAQLTDPKLSEKTPKAGVRGSAGRDYVQCLTFSPDGRLLAAGEYRMVKLWQREPNLPQFALGSDPATAIAASGDGKWIATAGRDNVIHLWDAATGKPGKNLTGHTGKINGLQFSPDNARLVSGSADKTLRVWDVAAGSEFAKAETANEITAVTWVLGGKQLASGGGDALIRLWELPAQAGGALKPGKELKGHTKPVTCLQTITRDGKQILSGSQDGSVRLWAVDQARQVRQMDHGAPVTAVAVSPDRKTVASAGGNSARLWSTDKGQMLGEMKGDHTARLRIGKSEQALAFAKNEITYWKTTLDTAVKTQTSKADALKKATDAAAAADKALAEKKDGLGKAADDKAKTEAQEAVKKAESASASAKKALLAAKTASTETERASADAKAASAKAAEAQQKAEADLEQAKKAVSTSEKPVLAVAFSPDGVTVTTAGDDQMIRTWSAQNGADLDTYPGQLGPVRNLAYTPDGRIISSADQNGAVVWRTVPSWHLARTIGTGDEKSPLAYRVLALDFSPDGQWLATGGGVPSRSGEVKIWKVSDSSLVREISPSHSDTVFSLSFSPDGKYLATGSADKFVKTFDVSTGKLVKSMAGHTHYVLSVAWNANGRTIVSSGADNVVKLWAFPDGGQLKTIEGFKKEVTAVRFLGIGDEILTTSGDDQVRLGNEEGKTLRSFGGSKGYLFTMAVTRDGKVILGGGQDSILRIWDAASGKALFSIDPPAGDAPPKNGTAK
jgi:WD40 repeat protein